MWHLVCHCLFLIGRAVLHDSGVSGASSLKVLPWFKYNVCDAC